MFALTPVLRELSIPFIVHEFEWQVFGLVLAKVVGNVVITKKNPHLIGKKIMIVRRVDKTGQIYGPQILAADSVDAGIGDYVVIVEEGGAAKQILNEEKNSPVDACIVGIVDDFKYIIH